MRTILKRVWSTIVGTVAGAAVGLAVAVVMMMSRFTLETSLAAVAGLAFAGGFASFLASGRTPSSP